MIKDLITAGIQAQIGRADAQEKTKLNTLRGGNTGMIDEQGNIIGTCAAATYLRMLGVNGSSVDVNKELMFAGGRLNEDHWLSALKESYAGPILCEEDVAIRWHTDQGIPVTGRPDIVLCEETDQPTAYPTYHQVNGEVTDKVNWYNKPVCGIELKQVMSVNSAYGVKLKREPQLKHLMQSAHYMWQLDCPFELWYTNRNILDVPDWLKFRPFPPPEDDTESILSYRFYRKGDINPKTGKPKKHKITEEAYLANPPGRFFEVGKIKPFLQGYYLKLDSNGQLFYKDAMEERSEWVQTIVSVDRIKRFYNFVAELPQYGKVPREPLNLTATGDKINWKHSDYSELKHLDPAHTAGRNLEKWVKEVKVFLSNDDKNK